MKSQHTHVKESWNVWRLAGKLPALPSDWGPPSPQLLDTAFASLEAAPALTCGHELWVVIWKNEILGWEGQGEELRHQQGARSRTARCSFTFERSQLRIIRHLITMPPERLPMQMFQASLTWKELTRQTQDYTIYSIWPGNILESRRKSWRTWPGRRTSGLRCLDSDKQKNGKRMDGLTSQWISKNNITRYISKIKQCSIRFHFFVLCKCVRISRCTFFLQITVLVQCPHKSGLHVLIFIGVFLANT